MTTKRSAWLAWPFLVPLLAGILLPAESIASWIRPPGDTLVASVTTGFWLGRFLLVLLAVVGIALTRLLPDTETSVINRRPIPWRALLVLTAIGVGFRLPALNAGLWYDEIQTLVRYVQQPMGILITTFDSTNQHLLYSALARLAVLGFGESGAAIRLPAVILGALSLPAIVVFARRWLPGREGWLAALLLAVSYHHIWFSQNARGYTGLLLGSIVGTTIFLDLLREGVTRRRVWAYGAVMAATALTHITGVVIVAAHAVVWLWQIRSLAPHRARWGPLAALILFGLLTLLLYSPVLPQLYATLTLPNLEPVTPQWKQVGWFLREAIGNLSQGGPSRAAVLSIGMGVGSVGLVSAWRRDRVVTTLMVLPLLAMASLLVVTRHNLWPRFFFFGSGFAVLIGVRGTFATLRLLLPGAGPRLGGVLLAAAALGSVFFAPRAWAPKQDFERAAEWVVSHQSPSDAVAVTDMTWLPLTVWLGYDWARVDDANALRAQESTGGSTWVLSTFPIRLAAVAPSLWEYLGEAYTAVASFPGTVGGGSVQVHRRLSSMGSNDRD